MVRDEPPDFLQQFLPARTRQRQHRRPEATDAIGFDFVRQLEALLDAGSDEEEGPAAHLRQEGVEYVGGFQEVPDVQRQPSVGAQPLWFQPRAPIPEQPRWRE